MSTRQLSVPAGNPCVNLLLMWMWEGGAMSRLAVILALVALVIGCVSAPTPTPVPAPTPTPIPLPPSLDGCDEQGQCAQWEFKGRGFLSATWLDETRIYLSTAQGSVELLDTGTGELRRVADGFSHPRGLAVLDGRLYVSHAGDSCEGWAALADELESEGVDYVNLDTLRQCYPKGYGKMTRRVLAASDGQLTSFLIGPDGELTDHALVFDGVPIGGGDHGHNGLTTDGVYVYGSVGYPGNGSMTSSYSVTAPIETLLEPGRGRDMAGAIYRFRPGDPEGTFEIFARGLRNTYGISIAPDGVMWGADNDGGSDQLEELNALRYGHDYGFPEYGTGKAPPEAGVTEPFKLISGDGSTVTRASDDGVYYSYTTKPVGPNDRVVDFTSYDGSVHRRVLHHNKSWVTALLEKDGLLYVMHLDGRVTVLDPERSSRRVREVPVAVRDLKRDGYYAFEPDSVEFEVGEVAAVDFQARPSEQHTLIVEGVDLFDGRPDGLRLVYDARSRPKFEHVFEKPGTYRFVCPIHEDQGMTGTITVRE